MSGIREPKKNGGSMSESQGKNLVGDPVYPKTGGREHHFAFGGLGIGALAAIARLGPWAMRTIPNIYRGMKAAKYIDPKAVGWGAKVRSALLPTARFTKMGGGEGTQGFRLGAAMVQNPSLAFMGASGIPQVGYLGYKGAKAAPGTIWEGTKRWADAVIPGDQSRWWKDKPPVKGVPLNPNLQKLKKEETVIDEAAAEEAALAKKQKALNERIKKYRDIMDIKGMNKQAAYKSLVDASKLIQESGDFKGDIKSGKLINQVIQAASKQFDKPAQASKAVDTLILKGEIEKDIKADDPSAQVLTELRGLQGKKIIKELNPDLNTLIAGYSKDNKGQSGINLAIEQYAKNLGYDYKGNIISKSDFKDTLKDIKTKTKGLDEDLIIKNYTEEVIKNQDAPDGAYSVGDKMVIIKDNQVIAVE